MGWRTMIAAACGWSLPACTDAITAERHGAKMACEIVELFSKRVPIVPSSWPGNFESLEVNLPDCGLHCEVDEQF